MLKNSLLWGERRFLSVSALWPFDLCGNRPCLETDFLPLLAGASAGSYLPVDPGLPKPRGEFLVVGDCYPPGGRATHSRAEAEVAGLRKAVEVWGDRQRQGGALHGPEPFASMPLGYERAFGGEGFADNPVGRGAVELTGPEGERFRPLANLMAPAESTPDGTGSTPTAFGQTGMDWEGRRKLAGTYDHSYIEKWMPGFPPDLDWDYFMQAAPDQWLPDFFAGDEAIRLLHMHPERPELRTALPGVRARIFVLRETGGGEELVELPARLDTVLLFPDREVGVVVHRGMLEGIEPDENDVLGLLVAHELQGDPCRGKGHYWDFYAGVRDPEKGFRYQLDPRPLLPAGFPSELEILQERQPAEAASTLARNLQSLGERKQEEVSRQVAEAQAEAEERLAGSPEAPQVHIQGLDGASGKAEDSQQPLPEEQVRSVLSRALPEKEDGSGEVDPARFDPDALGELLEMGERVAEEQLQEVIQQLEQKKEEIRERLPEAEQDAALAEIDAQIRALRGEVAVPLPRFAYIRERYDAQKEQLQSRIHYLHALGMDPGGLVQAKAHLDALDGEMERAVAEAVDGYRRAAHHQAAASSPHPGEEEAIARRLQEDLAAGIPPAGGDYAFTSLAGRNLVGADLTGAFLEYADLRGADLRGARLDRALLCFADLEGANLAGASFREANLGGARLDRADLSEADGTGAILTRTSLRGAKLRGARITEAPEPMQEAALQGADFTGADLRGNIFPELDFAGAVLVGANLAGCQFLQCGIEGARFDAAHVEGVNFLQVSGREAGFRGANLENARFLGGSRLQGADFAEASGRRVGFREADLGGASFRGAHLDQVDLGAADLRGATLDGARMRQAMLHRSDLDGCTARGADLMEAWLQEATLRGADLSGASLFGANLYHITLGGTELGGADLAGTILHDWVPRQ